jgi:flagellar biosynthesis/type III secretory pathway protein FliH
MKQNQQAAMPTGNEDEYEQGYQDGFQDALMQIAEGMQAVFEDAVAETSGEYDDEDFSVEEEPAAMGGMQ